MKITINVDTNDYNDCNEQPGDVNYIPEWSLFGLSLATFQDWKPIGQTGYWTVEGETFCGTRYQCEVDFRDDLLLRCLINKIKETCGCKLMGISIDDLPVTYVDDDLMVMRPEWLESMKQNA